MATPEAYLNGTNHSEIREHRLRDLYDFLKIDSTKIIVKSSDNEIPDFTIRSHISDRNIADYPQLFFSDKQHIDKYVAKFGIVLTFKLFQTYGYEFADFGVKIIMDQIFLRDGFEFDVDDLDLKFFMENNYAEMDFQKILDDIFVGNFYNTREKKLYTQSIEFCIQNGACMQKSYDKICESISEHIKSWGSNNPVIYLRYSCLDFSTLDVNQIVKIIADGFDFKCNPNCDLTDFITKLENAFDYSDPLVVKFVIHMSSINTDFFHKTMSRLMLADYFNEKHWSDFVVCINNFVGRTKQLNTQEFFTSFSPYGIDFATIFDNHIGGTDEEVNDVITILKDRGCYQILRKLAINRGLIFD
jgi:hypothetical protein